MVVKSEQTIKVYGQIVQALFNELGHSIDFEDDAEAVWGGMQTARGRQASNATIRTRVSAVINYIITNGGDPSFYKEKLRQLFEQADKAKNDPETYKKKENDATWKELSTLYTKYDKGQDRMNLALYTLAAAPRRIDYTNMYVVHNKKLAALKDRNYLVWNSSPRFIFNEYKTADKYGQQTIPVPMALKRILAETITEKPTGQLLLDNNGHAFTEAQFSDKMRRITGRHGKKHSVNSFRHAWITAFLARNPTTDGRMKMAKLMGNSIQSQLQYDRRDDSGDSD
jgi:hypothetical protein